MTPAHRERESRLRTLIAEQLGLELDEITADSKIGDDLGADSLDCVELVMMCEDEFDIEIDDDDADQVTTVRDLLALVEKKIGAKG